jgi:hypothetical protein
MNQRRSMKPLIGGVDRVAWSQWRKSQADKHAIKSAIEGAAFVADLRFELLAAYTGAVLAPRRGRKPRWGAAGRQGRCGDRASAEAIASAGGYLRDLTRKAAADQFSTGPMLMALIGGGQRERIRACRA